jgi:cytochrome c-type biogenesis protein CcmH
MTLSFLTLALLMLAAASLAIVLPLWRVAGRQAGSAHALSWRWPSVWLVTGLGMMAAGTYGMVGEPAALLIDQVSAASRAATSAHQAPQPQATQRMQDRVAFAQESPGAEGQVDPARIEAMVQRLAARLKANPQDAAGWRMLARSYESLGRFDQSVQAYRQLFALQSPDADQLLDFAVILGMSQGQSLAGEPEAAIDQALKLDPRHIQALALSGSAAYEQQDYPRAVTQWQKLLGLIPQGAPMRESIERDIDRARALAKGRR